MRLLLGSIAGLLLFAGSTRADTCWCAYYYVPTSSHGSNNWATPHHSWGATPDEQTPLYKPGANGWSNSACQNRCGSPANLPFPPSGCNFEKMCNYIFGNDTREGHLDVRAMWQRDGGSCGNGFDKCGYTTNPFGPTHSLVCNQPNPSASPNPQPTLIQHQPNIPLGGRAVAVDVNPNNSQEIMVASESGGLFRSTNSGANWTQVTGNDTFSFTDVKYFPNQQGVVIASADADSRIVSGGGIWRSTDDGQSWIRVNVVPPSNSCDINSFAAFGLAMDPSEGKIWAATVCGLAYSTDQGSSWSFIPATENGAVHAVAVTSPAHLVILAFYGVNSSPDDGVTWTNPRPTLPGGIVETWVHNQIGASPFNPNHLFWAFDWNQNQSEHHAVFLSTDFGVSWTSFIDAPSGSNPNRPVFLKVATGSITGKKGQYDLYFSDGSGTFERVTLTNGPTPKISKTTPLSFPHWDQADMAFRADGVTPFILVGDGGLFLTNDKGNTWNFSGGGGAGYDALQLEVLRAQLHGGSGGICSDQYIGMQDNGFAASGDSGLSWPSGSMIGGDGIGLTVWRGPVTSGSPITVTGTLAGSPKQQWGRLFSNGKNWNNPPSGISDPALVFPGTYVEEGVQNNTGTAFLTTNTGASWTPRFQLPKSTFLPPTVSLNFGSAQVPVLDYPLPAGTAPDGTEIDQIMRVQGATSSGTPQLIQLQGFRLGAVATMWPWYRPFGVDPQFPNRIMVPDVGTNQVEVSTDGGMTWNPDKNLTTLVTGGGAFKFSWNSTIGLKLGQVSAFGFDPNCDGHILVGTIQAGIFETLDRGAHWTQIPGSDSIPEVISFVFAETGNILISSYGRGVWDYNGGCLPTAPNFQLPPINPPTPVTGNIAAYVSGGVLSRFGDNLSLQSCSTCTVVAVKGGDITDFAVDKTGRVKTIDLSGGELTFLFSRGKTQPRFGVKVQSKVGGFSPESELLKVLTDNARVKGLLLERGQFKGAILASRDLTQADLPQKKPLPPFITLKEHVLTGSKPLVIVGHGFNPGAPLKVLVDGKELKQKTNPKFDKSGNFTISVFLPLPIGAHGVLVRQNVGGALVQDLATFTVAPSEKRESR